MSIASPPTPGERVAAAFARIVEVDRPEVWTSLLDEASVQIQASAVADRLVEGEDLRLAGVVVAVKDNIDVAGMPTTAACPSFAYLPAADAPCVAALRAAGAIVIGKTNMDQFATGLVGTRSPAYGTVRGAFDPALVSGGSSSGSAVAVALGLCDLALATDTAGSGRVPAAFQGIVGLKPSRGLISTDGVVPACASFDCVSVFAQTVTEAETAVAVMAGTNVTESPGASSAESLGPGPVESRVPDGVRFGVFEGDALADLSGSYRTAYEEAVSTLDTVAVDAVPFLEAGALMYGGAFVAERYAAVGAFIEAADRAEIDPSVRRLILDARAISATRLADDTARLERLRAAALAQLDEVDALLLPTAPFQPTIAAVQADPIGVNRRLGAYTTFCNLLDLCAVSIPGGWTPEGLPFGLTVYGRSGEDRAIAELARRLGHVT